MYELYTLANGLRVVIEKIDYVRTISVGLWVKNGSRNESASNNGISHFIEHMLFKGTYKRSYKEIAEAIEDVGGQLNAFTGKEATCFYVKSLDTHLKLSLDILQDMLFNSKFDTEEIEKEKSVIIEEINMTEDSPEDVLMDLHIKAIWEDDSLSLPILGSQENVKSFNREMLLDYLESHYIPENSVLSIAGNVDINEVKSLIEEYFTSWKVKNKIVTEYTKPSIIENNHLYKKKNIEQLHLSLGIRGLETGNDLLYSLLCLNNILGGGASSILFQKLREKYGLCYSVYSYISTFKNTGIVSIYAAVNPKSAKDAIFHIMEELNSFLNLEVSKSKIEKGKEQLKGNYILGLESTSSRMFNNGKHILFLNKLNTQDEVIKKIDEITLEKLKDTMDKTFKYGILNSAMVGNAQNHENLIKCIEGEDFAFKNKKSIRV